MVVGVKRRKMSSRRKKSQAQLRLEELKRNAMRDFRKQKARMPHKTPGEVWDFIENANNLGSYKKFKHNPFPRPIDTKADILRARKAKKELFKPTARIRKIPIISQVAKHAKASVRRQRKRALKGVEAIQQGALPPSSWIRALEYVETSDGVGSVHAAFTKRWYTFKNVPETLFNAWYAGAAATTTSDKSKARRWSIHDFPSVGAFFNQRIKGKYSFSRGKV